MAKFIDGNFFRINSNADKIEATIYRLENDILRDLYFDLNDCNYIEDINGNSIFTPYAYEPEKEQLSSIIKRLEKVGEILRGNEPEKIETAISYINCNIDTLNGLIDIRRRAADDTRFLGIELISFNRLKEILTIEVKNYTISVYRF